MKKGGGWLAVLSAIFSPTSQPCMLRYAADARGWVRAPAAAIRTAAGRPCELQTMSGKNKRTIFQSQD